MSTPNRITKKVRLEGESVANQPVVERQAGHSMMCGDTNVATLCRIDYPLHRILSLLWVYYYFLLLHGSSSAHH